MADLGKARAEIKRSTDILRSRYQYEHPIFGHLAAALEALEGDPPEATPAGSPPEETEEHLRAEAEAAVVIEEGVEETTEPKPPTRARKRG